MIKISQIKMEPSHTINDVKKKAAKLLRINTEQIKEFSIEKRSIDARKKDQIRYIYSVCLSTGQDEKVLKRVKDKNIISVNPGEYRFQSAGETPLATRPIIIGEGPCGLFCAYMLALNGFQPIVLERGAEAAKRKEDVEKFWKEGVLNPDSNVQFGEGGAGTFSDGKLNTQIKDPDGIIRYFLETFVRFGAKEEILYDSKPHIGTDKLITIVSRMREEIIRLGGEVHFHSTVTEIHSSGGKITGVTVNNSKRYESEVVVLAVGHSARDTFQMLYEKGFTMEAKAFAVGMRVEHLQETINFDQYGDKNPKDLPTASYKLTAKTSSGRGVYSFCMCPGGYVVNASSEPGMLAVNGMSYSKRDSQNANSAIIVSVTPEDYKADGPLAGVSFQRELERRAYAEGKGQIPLQRYGDFKENQISTQCGAVKPCFKGAYQFGNLRNIFPDEICESFIEGMTKFGYNLKGFDDSDALLSGVESRTSSPVRICREADGTGSFTGFYPAGEGAGYAGGITSAAVDGIRTAEKIAAKYKALF